MGSHLRILNVAGDIEPLVYAEEPSGQTISRLARQLCIHAGDVFPGYRLSFSHTHINEQIINGNPFDIYKLKKCTALVLDHIAEVKCDDVHWERQWIAAATKTCAPNFRWIPSDISILEMDHHRPAQPVSSVCCRGVLSRSTCGAAGLSAQQREHRRCVEWIGTRGRRLQDSRRDRCLHWPPRRQHLQGHMPGVERST